MTRMFMPLGRTRNEAMRWCKACQSFHPKPRSKAHHTALKCFAPYPGRKQP